MFDASAKIHVQAQPLAASLSQGIYALLSSVSFDATYLNIVALYLRPKSQVLKLILSTLLCTYL